MPTDTAAVVPAESSNPARENQGPSTRRQAQRTDPEPAGQHGHSQSDQHPGPPDHQSREIVNEDDGRCTPRTPMVGSIVDEALDPGPASSTGSGAFTDEGS